MRYLGAEWGAEPGVALASVAFDELLEIGEGDHREDQEPHPCVEKHETYIRVKEGEREGREGPGCCEMKPIPTHEITSRASTR